MENLFDPTTSTYDDVNCQCRALAYAAYKISEEDIREMLLFTLLEKQHHLEKLHPGYVKPQQINSWHDNE
ncbi:hypothetical protein ACL2XO_04960 [Sodalis sp. RH15]|uniref:hypothetical protein n=1 Tax=Sodalis sp. RH15 TaxID=3394330 RepID=UPI0039B5873A